MDIKEYKLSAKQLEEKESAIQKLLSQPLVTNWIKDNKLPRSFIADNSQIFRKYVTNHLICVACSGATECKLSPKEYNQILVYNNHLDFALKPCRYSIKDKINHRNYFLRLDLPERWLLHGFDNLTDTKNNKYRMTIKKINENLNKQPHKGLYLYGDVGVGKTHLLSCVANYYAKRKKWICFINMGMLSNRAKMYISQPNLLEELMNDMMKCDILILDDVGASKMSEWIRDDWLNTVLNHRLERNKIVYISSNIDYQGLRKYFTSNDGQDLAAVRLVDRIEALTEPLTVEGKNWRREEKI